MKTLHINVLDKIATYQKRDGRIVCDNSDYQIKFTFDDEWDAHVEKTARFIWGGQYFDQDFTGDTCPVPKITNAAVVKVGVYAGDLRTTTSAVVECDRSILSGGVPQSPESAERYTNEAKAAAEEAKAAAKEAGEAIVELDPAKICNAGTYMAKVIFETENEGNYFNVSAINDMGDPIIPPFYYRGSDNAGEILPTENEFTISVPECANGLAVMTNAKSYTLYATTANLVKILQEGLERVVYEYERDIPYVAPGDDDYQELPTTLALDRVQDGRLLDIVSVTISGYVNLDDGRACYFNQDITRQLQGVNEAMNNSFKMAGICSSLSTDSLSIYDFKLDISCHREKFFMKAERVVVGDSLNGAQRSTKANLSHVKVRSILARKIQVK